ncbi:ATP-binding cassette domain-containing protein [Streptomyces sp. ZYX-F-203]
MAGAPMVVAEGAMVTADGATLLPPTTVRIGAGECWCVTGGNGAGKTTLLRVLLGARRLTAGSCSVLGEAPDPTDRRYRRLVASLVEPIPIARDMTVGEQITLVAASWYGDTPDTVGRTEAVVERLGLASSTRRFPHQLSSGQAQLFSLAMTCVRPADLVLLDEPERHLDRLHLARVADLIAERAARGTAFLLATHDPVLIEACHGRVELV